MLGRCPAGGELALHIQRHNQPVIEPALHVQFGEATPGEQVPLGLAPTVLHGHVTSRGAYLRRRFCCTHRLNALNGTTARSMWRLAPPTFRLHLRRNPDQRVSCAFSPSVPN